MRKSFAFHPESWLSSPRVRKMSSAARGGYIMLLAQSWIAAEPGYLPNSDKELRRLAAMTPTEWKACRASILENFQQQGNRRYNAKLLSMIRKQRPSAPGNLPAPVPAELEDLELYREDAKLCRRWHELMTAWEKAYKGIDVLAEVRRAHAWELCQPLRKKDRPRFLQSWLNRTYERHGRAGNGAKPLNPYAPTEDDVGAWARKATGKA